LGNKLRISLKKFQYQYDYKKIFAAIIIKIMAPKVMYEYGLAKLKVHPIMGCNLGTINRGSLELK